MMTANSKPGFVNFTKLSLLSWKSYAGPHQTQRNKLLELHTGDLVDAAKESLVVQLVGKHGKLHDIARLPMAYGFRGISMPSSQYKKGRCDE